VRPGGGASGQAWKGASGGTGDAEPALLYQGGHAHDEQRSEGETGRDRERESEQGKNSGSASSRRQLARAAARRSAPTTRP
jgi:hypothetical protein